MTICKNSITCFLCACTTIFGSSAIVNAQARFINLSDQAVFVAQYEHQPYVPASAEFFHETSGSPEGWNFHGWSKVEPGSAFERSPGNLYVERGGDPLTWNGLSKSPGFVRNDKFRQFVPKVGWNEKARELLNSGYRKVEFQKFDNGNYTISGNAYRLSEKSFDFDFSSHKATPHHQQFPVTGQVAYIEHSGEQWGANAITWGHRGEHATVMLNTVGEKKRIGSGREPGYYRGKVTVHYIERQ